MPISAGWLLQTVAAFAPAVGQISQNFAVHTLDQKLKNCTEPLVTCLPCRTLLFQVRNERVFRPLLSGPACRSLVVSSGRVTPSLT